MLYSKHITFPFGQTENTATRRFLRMNKGLIYQIWINFPPGCAGLVKIRIYHEGHPFLPSQKDEFVRGDNVMFQYPIFYEIIGAPELITIEGWNEDDTYDHQIDVQFLVIPKDYIVPVSAYKEMVAALKSIFTR